MFNAFIDVMMMHPEIVTEILCCTLSEGVPDMHQAAGMECTSDDQTLQDSEPSGTRKSDSFMES